MEKQARGASCRKAEPRYGVSSGNCAFTATISQMRRISNSHKVFTPNKELCMRVIINSSEVYHSGTIAWIWHNGSTVPEVVNIFWGFVTFVFFTGKSWNSKNYVCAMNLKRTRNYLISAMWKTKYELSSSAKLFCVYFEHWCVFVIITFFAIRYALLKQNDL